jgi:hypothetical protein
VLDVATAFPPEYVKGIGGYLGIEVTIDTSNSTK